MWIIPKQLHTSRFVADMKELGLDSEEFSQMSEKSLMWRSKPSQPRTWLQRWKRESWMQHLCSRILKHSHTKSFVDAWTSSQGASLVSHSHLLESVKQLKIQDTSSHSSETESENANLELFSSKMLKESSPQKPQTENRFSSMSSENWKAWVTKQRQEYSQRVKSAHLINESESLSWATPVAMNDGIYTDNSPNKSKRHSEGLATQAVKNWGTPNTRDWKDSINSVPSSVGKTRGHSLGQGVAAELQRNTQPDQVSHNTSGKSRESQGKLNPDWVEQLMGLPVAWTDLGSWVMESFQTQQQKPS